ncbi:adenylate kinase isoform X2 [Eupeodes corollae]|uniref:adenylate kinase isoform X2 n=1 Tax=Eupeodes corollae TaxID=290404 RepID=UPI00249083CD|nr:adenylate kinase isoform X2 [Eupeodes corollae]
MYIDVAELEKSILKIAKIPLLIFINKTDKLKFEEQLWKFEKDDTYLGNRYKILLSCSESCDEATPKNFINITVKDHNKETDTLAAEILYKIKYSPIPVSCGFGCNYVYRIVILGRRGSGEQTQAKFLAARYNLVYVNIQSLIEETLQSKDNMAKILSIALEKQNSYSSSAIMALIWKRLMQPDTLSRGWVIVNFPKSKNELEILLKKFQTPPNRILILHCSKRIALRRLVKQWETSNTKIKLKNTITCVEKEFAEYDKNISSIYFYLKSADIQIVHVNGKESRDFVKNKVFALLERKY